MALVRARAPAERRPGSAHHSTGGNRGPGCSI